MPERMLYYEDIPSGYEQTLGEYHVTAEEIVAFAEQWDPQPFHLDETAAADSMFGELVASGLHTLSICQRLAVDGLYDEAAILGGAGMEVAFTEPVRPGDTLTASVTVGERRTLEGSDDRGLVRLEFELENQDGDTVLTNAVQTLIARRETA